MTDEPAVDSVDWVLINIDRAGNDDFGQSRPIWEDLPDVETRAGIGLGMNAMEIDRRGVEHPTRL